MKEAVIKGFSGRVVVTKLFMTALIAATVLMPVSDVQAAVTWDIAGGQLMGANGVLVDGATYDVDFIDGTCIGVFNGCNDASDFAFSTSLAATSASQSLLDQVLLDINGTDLFDSVTGLTFGLTESIGFLLTSYELSGGNVNYVYASNASGTGTDRTGPGASEIGFDTGAAGIQGGIWWVWAAWTPASPQ